MARFVIERETPHPQHRGPRLWLQWGRYVYDDGSEQRGYRFVWKRLNGSMQSRGPARIDSISDIHTLITIARRNGWGRKRGP